MCLNQNAGIGSELLELNVLYLEHVLLILNVIGSNPSDTFLNYVLIGNIVYIDIYNIITLYVICIELRKYNVYSS